MLTWQGPRKSPPTATPCSLAALPIYFSERPGPGSVVLDGGSNVGQVCILGHIHSVALSLGGPPKQEPCRGSVLGSWQLSVAGGGELLRAGFSAEVGRGPGTL